MTQRDGHRGVPGTYRPTAAEVDDLLRRASDHPLGTDFILEGALDSVAATFQVHAFVVEAARRALTTAAQPAPATHT